MNRSITNWLMDGPSWIQYATESQLLNVNSEVQPVLEDEDINKIIERLKDEQLGIPALMTGKVYYTKTGNVYWDLFFLADIGLKIKDLNLESQIGGIFDLQQPDGTFITQDNIKPNYYCIPTILLSSIVKMGYVSDIRINQYIELILQSQRLDGGWHCAKSRAVGQKLEDTESCPMDNLNILMLFSHFDTYRLDSRFNGAIDLLLTHWEKRNEKWRPYGFGIGQDFIKLKYPAVKYNILRVLDVLSLFPYALEKESFHDMFNVVQQKSTDGKHFAESIAKAYSEFDFGQKKEPSRWITFLINRIEKRIAEKSEARMPYLIM